MKIGILGGTFDPPHSGHLAMAQAAKEQLELDEVVFMPSNRNPLKLRRGMTAPKQRLELVRLMIKDEPGLAVSDLELTRGGPSYAVETMFELTNAQPAEYWFIMGGDSLKTIQEWKNPERLVRMCRLAVIMRPPLRENEVMLTTPPAIAEAVDIVAMPPTDVSSTDLRERVAYNRATALWLKPAVIQYIQQNKLYRS